jgi:vacuolar-type H+-ATPase subunit I/STV1
VNTRVLNLLTKPIINMDKNISIKIDEFIQKLNEIEKTYNDDKRTELSNMIRGFVRGVFGDKRVQDYNTTLDFNEIYMTSIGIFDKRIQRMRNFLLSLKEEIEAKELLGIDKFEPTMDQVMKKAEASKSEAERRKNVAEFKYWGFAIELIDTVRKELKEFRQIQEELLNNIKSLREDISALKEKIK